jgi:hypothetical protein
MPDYSNRIVKITIYPVVYEKDTNDDFVLDSNDDKIIQKEKEQILSTDNYAFVVNKELLNHGEHRFDTERLN